MGEFAKSFRDLEVYKESLALALEMQCWLDFSLKARYMKQAMYEDFDQRYEHVISQLIKMIDGADRWCR